MSVRIIEVGPRDGLQNEKVPIPTEVKLQFVRNLVAAGLNEIEVTSFVSPKWVPQLGDAAELLTSLLNERFDSEPKFSALVPNLKGLERAMEIGVCRIAVFTAASDAFTQKNINMTVQQSLDAFAEVVRTFRGGTGGPPVRVPPDSGGETFDHGRDARGNHGRDGHVTVRGYVSTAFECPYSGRVEPTRVLEVCRALMEIGVDELSIGDTIGVAAPREVRELTKLLLQEIPADKIAYHFHDTRGTAIANVDAALELGISAFDSSAAGLGGCPYAPGAGGNLATDDLVYFLERSGIRTGVDAARLAQASLPILEHLGRAPVSRAQQAVLGASCPTPG